VDQSYRRLARKLDELPHGFPCTDSGVELRILAKIFTPEDAAFAARLRPLPESSAAVARRLRRPTEEVEARLDEMAARGQIAALKVHGKKVYSLAPFVVGIWEFQLPHMDAELANLFEEYAPVLLRELGGKEPALARVVPVNARIAANAEVLRYSSLRTMLEKARSFRVMECICRVEAAALGHPCRHTLETCLAFSPEPEAYEGTLAHDYGRTITREEALAILDACEQEGLVHCTYNLQRHQMFVCNCCSCCCGFLRGLREFGAPHLLVRSDWVAVIDAELCASCGECADRCPTQAISFDDTVMALQVGPDRCIGCGVCTVSCPGGGITMRERPAGERTTPPQNLVSWAWQRSVNRSGTLRSVLRFAPLALGLGAWRKA
jgi:Na+-translocating ferredoxin:NAD+ oxidoreductase subunit B